MIFSICIFITIAENAFNCHLPEGCRLESGFVNDYYDMNEIGNRLNKFIICDINNNQFGFKFKDPPKFVNGTRCQFNAQKMIPLIFRWTSKELTILYRQFNFLNVHRYSNYMNYLSKIFLWSVKGFDLNFQKSTNYI